MDLLFYTQSFVDLFSFNWVHLLSVYSYTKSAFKLQYNKVSYGSFMDYHKNCHEIMALKLHFITR